MSWVNLKKGERGHLGKCWEYNVGVHAGVAPVRQSKDNEHGASVEESSSDSKEKDIAHCSWVLSP